MVVGVERMGHEIEPDDDGAAEPYCPVCHFPMREQRGCTVWCRNCGYKGVCGDPTS